MSDIRLPRDLHLLSASEIMNLVCETQAKEDIRLQGIDFTVFPGVFPSQVFRSSRLLLESIQPLVTGKVVADMGCGFGLMGLAAKYYGASKAILVDVNEVAVMNAMFNRDRHGFSEPEVKIFLSDCFDSVPHALFDVIIFNPPFVSDGLQTPARPIERAFYDPSFRALSKFLAQARRYSHRDTEIVIAFSTKGDVNSLQELFTHCGYSWEIWKIANEHERYDSRIYRLKNKTDLPAASA